MSFKVGFLVLVCIGLSFAQLEKCIDPEIIETVPDFDPSKVRGVWKFNLLMKNKAWLLLIVLLVLGWLVQLI